MRLQNRYLKRAHFSERVFRRLLRCFAEDVCALETAVVVGLNRNTVNRVFTLLRRRIGALDSRESPFSGEVEVDESYFGARRVRGKRGRGAVGKTIVFGILKRGDAVYTEIVPDCSKAALQAVIRGKVDPGTVVHSDGWRGYSGLVEIGYGHHRVDHGNNQFVHGKNHVNGIESFWSFGKRRLAKFNGISSQQFPTFLRETEFRFNHRHDNLYLLLLRELRKIPL
jgi:transposase